MVFNTLYERFSIGTKFLIPMLLVIVTTLGSLVYFYRDSMYLAHIGVDAANQVYEIQALNGDVQPPLLFITQAHSSIMNGLQGAVDKCEPRVQKGIRQLKNYEHAYASWGEKMDTVFSGDHFRRVAEHFKLLDRHTRPYLQEVKNQQILTACARSSRERQEIVAVLDSIYARHEATADSFSSVLIEEAKKVISVLAENDKKSATNLLRAFEICLVICAMALIAATWLVRSITRRTQRVRDGIERVEHGDLTVLIQI